MRLLRKRGELDQEAKDRIDKKLEEWAVIEAEELAQEVRDILEREEEEEERKRLEDSAESNDESRPGG